MWWDAQPVNMCGRMRKPVNMCGGMRKPVNMCGVMRKPVNMSGKMRKPVNVWWDALCSSICVTLTFATIAYRI